MGGIAMNDARSTNGWISRRHRHTIRYDPQTGQTWADPGLKEGLSGRRFRESSRERFRARAGRRIRRAAEVSTRRPAGHERYGRCPAVASRRWLVRRGGLGRTEFADLPRRHRAARPTARIATLPRDAETFGEDVLRVGLDARSQHSPNRSATQPTLPSPREVPAEGGLPMHPQTTNDHGASAADRRRRSRRRSVGRREGAFRGMRTRRCVRTIRA